MTPVVDDIIIGDPTMPALDPDSYGHWKEKMYKESHEADIDSRFFVDLLKSGHLEGKMSAREMTFARNVPPVAASGSK